MLYLFLVFSFFFLLSVAIIAIVLYFKSYPKKSFHKKNIIYIFLAIDFMTLFFVNFLFLILNADFKVSNSFYQIIYLDLYIFTPLFLLLSIYFTKKAIENAIDNPNIKWK